MLRLILGTLLLAAAALKGHQLATAPLPPGSPLPRPWLAVLVEGELLLGLGLVCGGFARLAWFTCVGVFALFAGYATWLLAGGADSCGCFGAADVPPAATLVVDLLALIALAFCRPAAAGGPAFNGAAAWQVGVPLWVMAAVGPPAAVAMTSFQAGSLTEAYGAVVLEPDTWTGQPLPILEHVDIPTALDEGRWTLVLYRNACGGCTEEVPRHERQADEWAAAGRDERVALVSVPPHAAAADDLPSGASAAVVGRLDDRRDWFVRTPTVVRLVDGVVVGDPPATVAVASSREGR